MFNVPSAEEVSALLSALSHSQLRQLATLSGVPFTTLWKIKAGETTDPRLNTIRELLPALKAITDEASQAAAAADTAEATQTPHAEAAGDRRDPATEGQFIHPHRRATDMRDGPSRG